MFFDEYGDHSYSMLRSFIRVRVIAPTTPPLSRTFDISQRTPQSSLIDAFLLATGHAEMDDRYAYDNYDRYEDYDSYDGYRSYTRDVRSLTFGPNRTINVPGVSPECWIEVLTSRDAQVGEPCVQIVDEDSAAMARGPWQSAPAPLRRAHVQLELTRRFGVVLPEVDTSGAAALSGEFGRSPLVSLLLTMPPARRLALRAHLKDSEPLNSTPMDAKTARTLLSGLSWLTDRLGAEGVEQDEHGGFPQWLAREAEVAMDWAPTSGSPPSPGHTLLALARSARFTRRLKGSMVPTAKTRAIKDKPLRALEDIEQLVPAGQSTYSWAPNHAHTLALLAIADGSGANPAGVAVQVESGLQVLESADEGQHAETDHAEDEARDAVREVMEMLAPLGGPGGYGMLTGPVRTFARMKLF